MQPERGKVVVVTGASSGAGRAIALAFARQNAKLVLAARRQKPLEDVADECMALGAEVMVQVTDVGVNEQVQALAAAANNWQARIDVWVNNAGVLGAGAYDETPFEVHEKIIRTNLLGYMQGAHAVLPFFKAQGYGILINNISVGGWFPTPYAAGYSASKFGLRGFSESLKGELSAYNDIHVCDVYPAFLDTPGMQHAANYTGKALRPAPPVFDPQRLANVVVQLSHQPQPLRTLGFVSPLLRLGHAIAPQLMRNVTAAVIRNYLKVAPDIEKTEGNIFHPQEHGVSIHGGWNSAVDKERREDAVKTVLMGLGIVAGLLLLRRR